MNPKTVYDLSDICESVFTGRPLTEAEEDENKKKEEDSEDSGSPFADTDDGSDADDSASDSSKDTEDESSDASPFDGDTGTSDDMTSEDDQTEETEDGADDTVNDDTDTDDFGGSPTTEADDLAQLGIEIIMLSAQAHFWHINCRKGSQHEALNELYLSLAHAGDRLLEAVISTTDQSVVANGELSFDFGNLEFESNEALGILEDVRDHVNEVASSHSEDQTFANILGDISETLSSTIYKLSRFDSEA